MMLSPGERAAILSQRLGLQEPLPESLCTLSLSHASWAHERGGKATDSNERLEFFGDGVLDLAVSQRLYQAHPEADEGELTRLYAQLVNEDSLARVARALGLAELLLLGRGEEKSGGRQKPSVLADTLEAVIAAVYLAQGIDAVLAVVDRVFAAMMVEAAAGSLARDAKSTLLVLSQKRGQMPMYRVHASGGPEHARQFHALCLLDGEVVGEGDGRSKKEAEQAAARVALDRLST